MKTSALLILAFIFSTLINASPVTGIINFERSIVQHDADKFEVTLKFDASHLNGKLRVTESIIEKCVIVEIETGGAVVTSNNNQIKFEWSKFIQTKEKITLRYACIFMEPVSASPVVEATVYYMGNDPSSKPTGQPKPTPSISTTAEIGEAGSSSTHSYSMASAKSTTEKVSARKQDIVFRIQLLSTSPSSPTASLKSEYNFDDAVDLEKNTDRTNYLHGRFSSFDEAKSKCEFLKSNYPSLPGPFVVAYRNGVRIALQDALDALIMSDSGY